MHLVGVWSPGAFYIKTGEKYFNSAYGVACLGWDGAFHMILQGVRMPTMPIIHRPKIQAAHHCSIAQHFLHGCAEDGLR
jgi:hypothetical protein